MVTMQIILVRRIVLEMLLMCFWRHVLDVYNKQNAMRNMMTLPMVMLHKKTQTG